MRPQGPTGYDSISRPPQSEVLIDMATVDSLEDPPTDATLSQQPDMPAAKESRTRDPHQTSDLVFGMSSTSDAVAAREGDDRPAFHALQGSRHHARDAHCGIRAGLAADPMTGSRAAVGTAGSRLGSALVHAVRGRDEKGAAMLHEALTVAEPTGAPRRSPIRCLTLNWHSSADHTLAHTYRRLAPRRLLNQQEVPMPLINVRVIGDVKALAAGTPA